MSSQSRSNPAQFFARPTADRKVVVRAVPYNQLHGPPLSRGGSEGHVKQIVTHQNLLLELPEAYDTTGGPETRSGYGSLNLSWNIMNSGRDVGGLHSAIAGVHAASLGLDGQLSDTLSGILQAYADLYEAEVDATSQATATEVLKEIYVRAEERFSNGNGTTVAIGQVRSSELEAEQSLNKACRTVVELSAALPEAVGIRIPAQQRLTAVQPLPMPIPVIEPGDLSSLDEIVENTPTVAAAKAKVDAATAKFQHAKRSFGPSITFTARKGYLGQSVDSLGAANHHIDPSDYRVNLGIQQSPFSVATEEI